ncbi:hypothetical protein FQA47_008140 [Oryzias melastigma]|uniref:Uncharacterized protein n=1 Tax=Oryzias melastigma TaxID=30732 RepID=A0A834FBE8_ORYME|nr:hypothetical protein FQA47_008140 [Oryzias melastigma]
MIRPSLGNTPVAEQKRQKNEMSCVSDWRETLEIISETDLLLLYKYSVKLSKYYISARVFLILKLNTLSFRHVEGTPLGLRVRGGVGATKAWQGHRGGQRPRGSCHWSGSKPAIQSCKHAVQTPMWETRLRRTRQEIVQEFTSLESNPNSGHGETSHARGTQLLHSVTSTRSCPSIFSERNIPRLLDLIFSVAAAQQNRRARRLAIRQQRSVLFLERLRNTPALQTASKSNVRLECEAPACSTSCSISENTPFEGRFIHIISTGKSVLRIHPAQLSPRGARVRSGSGFHARLADQRAAVPKLGSADLRAHGAALSMNEDEPQSGAGILRLAGEREGEGGRGPSGALIMTGARPPAALSRPFGQSDAVPRGARRRQHRTRCVRAPS